MPQCLSGKVKNEWSYTSFHEQGKLYICHALYSLNEQAFLCLLWLLNFLFRCVLIKSSVSYFLMEEAKQIPLCFYPNYSFKDVNSEHILKPSCG